MRLLTLSAITFFGLSSVVHACPDFTAWGNEAYEATGAQLLEQQNFEILAGGVATLAGCDIELGADEGAGYFIEQPDFSFDITAVDDMLIEISVVSECDSALLVNTGEMSWFYDDDSNGNGDAKLTLQGATDGVVDVWVGTYDGEVCDSILSVQTSIE